MKNLNTQMIILLTGISLMGVGCSKSGGGSDPAPVNTTAAAVAPAPAGLSGTTTSNGITFTPVSLGEMTAYVGSHPLNNPTNYGMTVSLSDTGGGKYAGTVTLSYDDNGQHFVSTLKTCLNNDCINKSYSSVGTSRDNGVNEASSNYWFTLSGKQVFSGFFQDNYGGVVLIIDNVVNQGDGQGGGYVSGQVWYHNFAQSTAPISTYRQCWFIYTGPYDCQSSIVSTKSALYPTDTYRKLGSFSGLMKSAAFQ